MMDQYKKETAQIHAPAALIEMTKAAVREEENRIRREQTGQIPISAAVPQAAYAGQGAYHKKRSLRRWTYPVTAAAAVVILVSVSMAIKDARSGRSMSGQADTDMMTAQETEAVEEACAEMTEEINSGTDSTAAGSTEGAADSTAVKDAGGAETESAAIPEEAESTVAQAPADLAEDNMYDSTGQEDDIYKSAQAEKREEAKEDSAADTAGRDMKEEVSEFRSGRSGMVRIETVEEKPDFYGDSDAADVIYEGQTFRIVEEEKGWAAYVETETGEAYVIRGRIKDRDDFLREAYAKLAEM